MGSDSEDRIDPAFRSGTMAAVSVVLGFSLSFLSRWAGLPGTWHRLDLAAVLIIVGGIVLETWAMGRLLQVECLVASRYRQTVRIFMTGTILVSTGIAIAIVGDITGLGQRVLGG